MKTLLRWLNAGFHTSLLFVLPWLIGAIVGTMFDIDEVSETKERFAKLYALIALPLMGLQLWAIVTKVGREIRAERAQGRRGMAVVSAAVERHVRVLTHRGLGMAVAAFGMVMLALTAKWGQFGVLAVAGLGTMYLASTYATAISAFSVRDFDDRVQKRRGGIRRMMSQPLVEAGDPLEERFVLERVPIPYFFRLHIDEELPSRLGGDTRFALDRSVSRASVTVSAPLPRTPRGVYRLGPASIWYEDILGLTRVFVATRAESTFRALPRQRPLTFDRKPKSLARAEGTLSVLSNLATEDHFKTRTYVHGDDRRRIHWKRSINAGELVIRVPEAVPFAPTRIRLLLDTHLPPAWRVSPRTFEPVRDDSPERARAPEPLEDVLDLLVETWIALAHMLVRRHESVTIVCAVREGDRIVVREMPCKRGEERKWRAFGSDVAWQVDVAADALVANTPSGDGAPTSSILVTAGLSGVLPTLGEGASVVVADGASVVAPAPAHPVSMLERVLAYDYPVGAEDNAVDLRRLFAPKPRDPERVRRDLAQALAVTVDRARAAATSTLVVRRRGGALALEQP